MNDQEFEVEVKAKGLTAPRVTLEDVSNAAVAMQSYVFPGTTTTVVCLTLRNGFTVIGESACASPENFDAELGIRLAHADAQRKIWQLEGYALKDRLYREQGPKLVNGCTNCPDCTCNK